MFTFTSSKSNDYCSAFDVATCVIINSLIFQGKKFISLEDLYSLTNAVLSSERTSVRMSIRKAKAKGMLINTNIKGVYRTQND